MQIILGHVPKICYSKAMKEKTRQKICAAYLKLIEQKPADKITVKDIAKESGVNRNTFYYHYQDIDALVDDIAKSQTEMLISRYPAAADSVEAGVDFAVKSALDKKKVLMYLYQSSSRTIFENYLWKICDGFVDNYVKKNTSEDRSFFIRYQKCFLFGLLIDWFNNGMPESFLDDMHKAFETLKM